MHPSGTAESETCVCMCVSSLCEPARVFFFPSSFFLCRLGCLVTVAAACHSGGSGSACESCSHFLKSALWFWFSAVIPFMEVFNKSLCRPRELLIEILQEYPEEVEHIFIPSCVVLRRCAGCCTDEMLQCTPTASYNVTMEVGIPYL